MDAKRGHTDAHNEETGGGTVTGRLTISEAAAFLGVHKNTVRNRIKDGTYEAEKVLTERGETYYIDRESLLKAHRDNPANTTLPSASQQVGSVQGMEFARELLRPFIEELGTVREELGAERARRKASEQRALAAEDLAAALTEELRQTQEALEASQTAGRGGEGYQDRPFTQEAQAETSRPWWRRLFGG